MNKKISVAIVLVIVIAVCGLVYVLKQQGPSPSFTTQQVRRGSPARKTAQPFMFHAEKVDTEQSR